MADSVLLQSCFRLLPKKSLFEVRLTRKKLIYQQTSTNSCCGSSKFPQYSVNIEDIYGAKVMKRKQLDDVNAYLHIFTCPVEGDKRIRKKLCFKVNGWDDVDANIKTAERWLKMILWLVKDPEINIEEIHDRKHPAQRKLLVFANPFSGSGKSVKIFNNKVAPMFDEGSIDYTLIITEYAGHAEKIAMELNIEEWDGLVICSGDGLIYELVNGLMKRTDWETAIRLPVGAIPTGSGNALCFSALYASGEPFDLTAAIFGVLRGQTRELDLCTLETPGKTIYSFLSVTWGIMSDVDIESEKYRYLGNARFTLGALIRIFGLRTYRGRLSYLAECEDDICNDEITTSIDVPKQLSQDDDDSRFYSFPNSLDEFSGPENTTLQSVAGLDNTGFMKSPFTSINGGLSQSTIEGPKSKCLPPIRNKLPSNWKTIEGVFVLSCSVLLSHLGPDLFVSPLSKFGDGSLYIAYIKSGISRLKLLSLFNKMGTGGHVDAEECVYLKVRAFRLEPDLSQAGTIAVDGEKIPYSVIQGEVHKGLGRVMCSKP